MGISQKLKTKYHKRYLFNPFPLGGVMKRLIIVWILCLFSFAFAKASDFKPAIMFNSDLVMDKSFNEALYNGMALFEKKRGISFAKATALTGDTAAYEKALRSLAEQGFNPILAPGFGVQSGVQKIANEFPKTDFIEVDYVIELPNVYSIMFKEHEGAFFAGVVAGQPKLKKLVLSAAWIFPLSEDSPMALKMESNMWIHLSK